VAVAHGNPITIVRATGASAGSFELETAGADELRRLRAEFDERHCLKLPGLLSPGVFSEVAAVLREAAFTDSGRESFVLGGDAAGYVEATMKPGAALALLLFLTNDPRLFDAIRAVTGCGPVGHFKGRVYRMDAGAFSSWHDDVGDGRMVAMSVNLGTEPYEGGVLQLRESASEAFVAEAPNRGPGDAIVFRVDERLEHHITPVEGTAPKISLAGWFTSRPGFLSSEGARRSHSTRRPQQLA
jgi:hypothetical protein